MVTRLEAGFWETDTLADDVVACFADLPGRTGWQMLESAITRGIDQVPDAPPPLIALFEQAATVPAWVDWEQMETGRIAYLRPGLLTGLGLGCASLAAGYRSGAGVKPLVYTGRIVNKAGVRLRETGRWIHAVTTPGGMRPGGAGFAATLKVRLVHAMVRRRLQTSPDWQWDDWGAPLNDSDLVHGIVGEFSTVMIDAVVDAGIHYSQAEREAMHHLWRYIGHVLGVPADLLPDSEARALAIVGALDLTESAPDDDSTLLVHALINDGLIPALPLPAGVKARCTPVITTVLYGLTRRWAGPELAAQFDLPSTRTGHLIPLIRPAVQALELARRIGLRSGSTLAAKSHALVGRTLAAPEAPTIPVAGMVNTG
ncbi:oxygenase MpaB family protein [Tomitella biformata]|uniref:oxygenase MpaB family protein n=1 Tax=Tomitella biformata TaxID=630403 RepID=UPI00046450B9|nr:oxygenase MpaB family protein [Tomitella biformata]